MILKYVEVAPDGANAVMKTEHEHKINKQA
jgi:hypothetical protein